MNAMQIPQAPQQGAVAHPIDVDPSYSILPVGHRPVGGIGCDGFPHLLELSGRLKDPVSDLLQLLLSP